MPVLSAFTPCGALQCSSAPSHIEEFYNLLQTLYGSEIDFTIGTPYDEPKLYATACMLALGLYELEHAGNQQYPASVYDMLPLQEIDFGLVPGPLDSIVTRQLALAAAEKLPLGCVPSNMVNALRAIVGAAFQAYVPNPAGASRTVFPPSPGAGPGAFKDVRVPARVVQLVDPVATTGSNWVAYKNWDPTIPTPTLIYPADVVVVDVGITAVMEQVTVTATAAAPPVGSMTTPGYNYFQATFANAHHTGAPVTTGNVPYWWSTQRLAYIVLSGLMASDRPTRAKIDTFMAKLARGPDVWATVTPSSVGPTGGTIGPLTVGSPMGTTSVGTITYANSM